MKKICFVTTIYTTYHCFLKDFGEYLYQTGEYDISLICADEERIAEELPPYVHFHPVTMKRGVSLSGIFAIKQMRDIFKQNKYDIVQYSTPNAAFYASIASRLTHIPVRLYCQWGIRYMGFNGWKRSLFKVLEKLTCSNSTCIEAESWNIRNFSLAEGLYTENRSCVIWNGSACGVDLRRFDIDKKAVWREQVRRELRFANEDVVFAFAARLTADKGINELLQAFLAIAEKNAKLLVMGGMDDRASLDIALMEQARASVHITFTGNVENIERYYAASDVFVAPSYREGFGLVVVEAEAMGLPAIVSNVPGQIDAIEENITGLVCEVKDPIALEKAIRELLENQERRREMGEAAHQFVESCFEQNRLFEALTCHRNELTGR